MQEVMSRGIKSIELYHCHRNQTSLNLMMMTTMMMMMMMRLYQPLQPAAELASAPTSNGHEAHR
jgi:hypothetical protein